MTALGLAKGLLLGFAAPFFIGGVMIAVAWLAERLLGRWIVQRNMELTAFAGLVIATTAYTGIVLWAF